jgi:hypothetical protein
VALSTATLLFASNRETRNLNVFDKDDGTLLRSINLGASNVTGSPMTYMWNDKQYVVTAVGRNNQLIELVALSLPAAAGAEVPTSTPTPARRRGGGGAMNELLLAALALLAAARLGQLRIRARAR